jgi:hypothetical protein
MITTLFGERPTLLVHDDAWGGVVDVVLGVSMGSTAIRMVLVEGERADGATVDEDDFQTDATDPDEAATAGAHGQVLSAILGTREGAADGGHALTSTGVVCCDPTEAAALRDALAAYKVENVMLVSAFVAASALAQAVGHATGCSRTAMLLVEPDSATLGIVDSDDGSVTVVCTEPRDTAARLADMVASCDTLEERPEGVFVVGDGVDIAPLKPALEAATRLTVSAPEEPETALARGAALASANTRLSASTGTALAYSQDSGTDNLYRYLSVPDVSDVESKPIAYSSVSDPETDSDTVLMDAAVDGGRGNARQPRGPLLLVGSTVAAAIVIALVALEVALAINIRTTVALQPSPQQNLIVPTTPPPAPAPAHRPPLHAAALLAPQPAPSVPSRVTAPVPAAQPVPIPAAQPAPVPAAAPAPVPAALPAPPPVPMDPLPLLFPFPAAVPVPAAPPQVPNIQLPQPVAILPAPPVALPNPPALIPTPPVKVPVPPPAQLPTPPAQLPTPPTQLPLPKPPVQLPTPPAQLPTPKVQLPTPQVQLPKPPAQLPAPPAQLPAPQVQLPRPAIQLPTAPTPPVQLPVPQVQLPKPPLQLPAAPAPPAQLPALPLPLPNAPSAPGLPLPAPPQVPAAPGNPLIPTHIGP